MTRSSVATFRDFHTNSQTAMTHATPMPPINTTNTPPTLANPNSFAVELDFEVSSYGIGEAKIVSRKIQMRRIVRWLTLQEPPPRFSFHQRVFKMCSFPSSCNFNTAPFIAVRYGESAIQKIYRGVRFI